MKKIITALLLFDNKIPNTEVRAIEQTFKNWFKVTVAGGGTFAVNIGDNSVKPFLDDPDWDD